MNAPHSASLPEEAHDEFYLGRLGERVRAWRNAQRMTRKQLAEASGVSERYLAQLEAGRGNISVLLLRRVARARRRAPGGAGREGPAPRAARPPPLGLRGAGKSTLGAKLAQALELPFIELDREVEKE